MGQHANDFSLHAVVSCCWHGSTKLVGHMRFPPYSTPMMYTWEYLSASHVLMTCTVETLMVHKNADDIWGQHANDVSLHTVVSYCLHDSLWHHWESREYDQVDSEIRVWMTSSIQQMPPFGAMDNRQIDH